MLEAFLDWLFSTPHPFYGGWTVIFAIVVVIMGHTYYYYLRWQDRRNSDSASINIPAEQENRDNQS